MENEFDEKKFENLTDEELLEISGGGLDVHAALRTRCHHATVRKDCEELNYCYWAGGLTHPCQFKGDTQGR